MIATWVLLFQSRKFWVGAVTILSMLGAIGLVALGKLDASALTTTIAAISGLGIATIGSIAWEDSSKAKIDNAKNVVEAMTSVAKSFAPPAVDKKDESNEVPKA